MKEESVVEAIGDDVVMAGISFELAELDESEDDANVEVVGCLESNEDSVDDSVAVETSATTDDKKLVDASPVDIDVERSIEEDSVEATWIVDAVGTDSWLVVEEI